MSEQDESLLGITSPVAKNILYCTLHLVVGEFSGVVTAWGGLELVADIKAGGSEAYRAKETPGPQWRARGIGVAEALCRSVELFATMVDEPIPQHEEVASLRRGISCLAIVSKAGFAAFDDLRPVATAADAVLALISDVPTVLNVIGLTALEASTNRSLSIMDETSNICESTAAMLHFAAMLAQEGQTRLFIVGAEVLLIGGFAGLHAAMAVVRIANPR